MRQTIDFGIDLGVENSRIAVYNGESDVRVFKNNEGQEFTPSAVWIDGKGKLYVGRLAKEHLEDDSENAYCEFKLHMGTNRFYSFTRNGRRMTPEELTAEVIKSLRGDVFQSIGEQVTVSCITVPYHFLLPQVYATVQAAKLAGLEHVQIIQEPVAAAIAHGFHSSNNDLFWMVVDFAGGTFDAFIMQVRDGVITVVDHTSDIHLGSKYIVWDIVDKIFIPLLTRRNRLTNFHRGNPEWRLAFNKLYLLAEKVIVQLLRDDSIYIFMESLCQDNDHRPVKVEYEMKRSEVYAIVSPYIARMVKLYRKMLQDADVTEKDIAKTVLYGQGTLNPFIRIYLEKELSIPLNLIIDPATAVRGAAIFAGTIDINKPTYSSPFLKPEPEIYKIELKYEPVGQETDLLVDGKATTARGGSLEGFTIEITAADTHWSSGKITLKVEGIFTAKLNAKSQQTEFIIELTDAWGNHCTAVPDRFIYTKTDKEQDLLLINSISILMSDKVIPLLIKGTLLPARKRTIIRTTESSTGSTLLQIPVMEGESFNRANRNRLIGYIEITAGRFNHHVPVGSEVEITISIDIARIITTKAYIPVIDEEFENILRFNGPPADPLKMKADFKREKARYELARQAFIDIQQSGLIVEIDSLLAVSPVDPDAAEKCFRRILDLKIALDTVEDALILKKDIYPTA